ncbi:hypothetical protein EVAR_28660_1 [Eumeta japonica]|uniref:Uncharacterized protein n=1 Tax=Eumeta variegata TaxID=151549 RepID=A0A4C1V5K2_EUMVA|nr:hypothetical protein EVAR_28660_1 [Eumeta japonica]
MELALFHCVTINLNYLLLLYSWESLWITGLDGYAWMGRFVDAPLIGARSESFDGFINPAYVRGVQRPLQRIGRGRFKRYEKDPLVRSEHVLIRHKASLFHISSVGSVLVLRKMVHTMMPVARSISLGMALALTLAYLILALVLGPEQDEMQFYQQVGGTSIGRIELVISSYLEMFKSRVANELASHRRITRRSSPSMVTRNPTRITHASLTSRVEIEYLMEEKYGDGGKIGPLVGC